MPNLQPTKISFINSQNLTNSSSFRDFWHLSNNISNNFTSSAFSDLLQSDGSTAISSFSKAELFIQTVAINSTLDSTGHILSTLPASVYFIPKIKILYYDVFHALSDLDCRKAYGPGGVPPLVLNYRASDLATCLSNSFVCVSLLLSILFVLKELEGEWERNGRKKGERRMKGE